jgi:ABC-type dipeptide/oligopeptide/nickel transport system permease subunit
MRPSKRHRLEKKERQLQRRPRKKRVDPLLGRRLIEEQKPRHALLAGAVVAMAGAMIWTIVALATSFSFQWLAIGIGAACGFAVGHFGRAVDRRFARMSAYFCILACVCGELLVAYALQLEIWLLYSANSLTLLVVFLLAGAVTAHLCTFAWLSRAQKQALRDERYKRGGETPGASEP